MRAVLGTRKGVITLARTSTGWQVENANFDGVNSPYVHYDLNSKTLWAGLNHGHWGPKLHYSRDLGRTFVEVTTPKFPDGDKASFRSTWSVAVASSSSKLFVGSAPVGLFESGDMGDTWQINDALHRMDRQDQWFGGGADDSCLHSILLDPRNESIITIGISVAGVLQSRDGGKSWEYCNKGQRAEFLPDRYAEVGQDPHLLSRAPSNPDIIWNQNHCGIFKSVDGGRTWADFSDSPGLASSFGWAVAIDETSADIAYTVPAVSDESRVPVGHRLIVQKTVDGGQSWRQLTKGLPDQHCYDICYRHALALSGSSLMFGTTTGGLFASNDAGESWQSVSSHLPPIYSLDLMP